jgi:hypothetical protein
MGIVAVLLYSILSERVSRSSFRDLRQWQARDALVFAPFACETLAQCRRKDVSPLFWTRTRLSPVGVLTDPAP